jgi:hypothetical protein
MRVEHVETPGANRTPHAPRNGEVDTGPPVERHDVNALVPHLVAKLPDLIETENYRVDSSAKTSDGLGDEHLGARNLHDVEHEADSDGMGQRAAP